MQVVIQVWPAIPHPLGKGWMVCKIKSPGLTDYYTDQHEDGNWSTESIDFEIQWRTERYQSQGYQVEIKMEP